MRLLQAALIIYFAHTNLACSHLFYYPTKEIYQPKENIYHHDDLTFAVPLEKNSQPTQISAWYFNGKQKKDCVRQRTLIVYLHGNAENVSTHMYQMVWVTELGADLMLFDYPGYGESGGEANRENIHQATVKVIDEVLANPKYQSYRVILYGQSLGGTILLGALPEIQNIAKVSHIIIESSFASYQRIGRRKLSQFWLSWPLQWLPYLLVSDAHSVDNKYRALKLPPLTVIHGEQDRVVPILEGKELFELLPQPKEFWPVPLAGHLQPLHPASGIRERLAPIFCGK
jgi:uncharacterized protein